MRAFVAAPPLRAQQPLLRRGLCARKRPRARVAMCAEFAGWSPDFVALCRSQLELVASSVHGLSQVALFFRREGPGGSLEFVPLVVHSVDGEGAARVWIGAGFAGDTTVEMGGRGRALPGGIPASWILPDYPFVSVGAAGGIVMPDGGLCVPIEHNQVLAGSIVLWPEERKEVWAPEDLKRAGMVAKSIALGAALEGKWTADARSLANTRVLVESMRTLIRSTLHQIRSPVAALVTFGHLLLRKLPPGDYGRDLAKNVIVASLRVGDLLNPLDVASARFTLAPAEAPPSYDALDQDEDEDEDGGAVDEEEGDVRVDESLGLAASYQSPLFPGNGAEAEQKQLVWMSDIVAPIVRSAYVLAEELGLHFCVDIDDDTPPVLAVERNMREAISNLMDNALKYTPKGATVGIKCALVECEELAADDADRVVIAVWDTGRGFSEEDLTTVWESGKRGSAAAIADVPGSGLGLQIARQLISESGGELVLTSPLPAFYDPRVGASEHLRKEEPGSVFEVRISRARDVTGSAP